MRIDLWPCTLLIPCFRYLSRGRTPGAFTVITQEHRTKIILACDERRTMSNVTKPGKYQIGRVVTASFLKISVKMSGLNCAQDLEFHGHSPTHQMWNRSFREIADRKKKKHPQKEKRNLGKRKKKEKGLSLCLYSIVVDMIWGHSLRTAHIPALGLV